jgi:hypothetical protein
MPPSVNMEAEGTYTTTRPDVRPHSASIAIMMLLPPPAHETMQIRPSTMPMQPADAASSKVQQYSGQVVTVCSVGGSKWIAHAGQNLTSGTIQVQPWLFAGLHQLYQIMHALPVHDKICLRVRQLLLSQDVHMKRV